MVLLDVHQVGGEHIHAEERVLVPQLHRVERVRYVEPECVSDEPLVAVGELLAPDLCGDRKLLQVTDEDIGHLQLEGAVVLGQILACGRPRVAVIAEGVARPRLDDKGEQVASDRNP